MINLERRSSCLSCDAMTIERASEKGRRLLFLQDRDLHYRRVVDAAPPFSADQIVGKSDFDILPLDDAQRLTQMKRKVLETNTGTVTELRMDFDGQEHLFEITLDPWLDLDGNLLGVLGNVSDISRERALREALSEQFRRTCTIFDSLNVLVYVADLTTYELIFINAYGQKLFGNDAVGKPCFRVLQAGKDAPCQFCTNHRLVVDGRPQPPYTWEFQNTATGRWFLCIDQAIPWTDGTLKRMEVAVDISDRKQAEQFRQEYVGIISHDLSNPLNSLTLGCQVLERRVRAGGRNEDNEILQRMKRNADRM
jgi:PAS domain-containing protein